MSTRALIRNGEKFPTIFDDFFRPWNEWFDKNSFFAGTLTVPAVNICEGKDAYTVSLAAPGMKKDDFIIDVNGNIITISSQKENKKEEKEDNYTRKEYNYSSFSRSFTVPDEINREKIEARYEDGVLKLSLPKTEESRKAIAGKHIAVK